MEGYRRGRKGMEKRVGMICSPDASVKRSASAWTESC